MKAVVALALIALLIIAVVAAVVWVIGVRRARCELREESDGEHMAVLAVKRRQQALVVVRVPFGAEDFDSRLHEARAEGRARVAALNAV